MWGICGKTLDKMGLDPHILARGLDPPISAKTLDHPILAIEVFTCVFDLDSSWCVGCGELGRIIGT